MRHLLCVLSLALFAALPAAAATYQVTVHDFEFLPATLVIQQGDTVTWTDVQGTHSVMHACGTALFGTPVADAPWTYSFVFNLPAGDYPYLCEVHPDLMLGTITVQRPPHRWNVTVQNFSFTPPNLTVQQGDTVVWTNISGFHGVHHNASPSLFGIAAAPAPWTYTFVFNLPAATYPYVCPQHPTLMQGTITVQVGVPPSAPSTVVIYESSGNAVLTWGSIPGALCYTVYRSPDSATQPFTQLVGITGDTTFVQPMAALTGSMNFFQIRAVGN